MDINVETSTKILHNRHIKQIIKMLRKFRTKIIHRNNHIINTLLVILVVCISCTLQAQKPFRVGTTTANFLEIGYGTAGTGMGDAYVSMARDLSAIYWNPAGLAYLKKHQALFVYQPWLVDTRSMLLSVGYNIPTIGTFAISMVGLDFGTMDVTTLAQQEGTGEKFTAVDQSFVISYGRKLATWFATGASLKYISSKVWHLSASAFAFDLGVLINTPFFSPTGNQREGLTIGMSISNYGTKMSYDGMDLLFPIDILQEEDGNYANVEGKYALQEWELPLIFRLGISVNLLYTDFHQITVAIDALHPNNNSESVNIGTQYLLRIPTFGKLYMRGGYKALFMDRSEYGPTFGFGVRLNKLHNTGIDIGYAYRSMGILGNSKSIDIGVHF